MSKDQIRNAATIVLLRQLDTGPAVLMGQRGKSAAFMPEKFVFPGGAVDPSDGAGVDASGIPGDVRQALECESSGVSPQAILCAAARELSEETGLSLKTNATGTDFSAFKFIFRAITPPGRSRRFDARFLLVDANAIDGDPDDFSNASDELSNVQWIGLSEARNFPLPFITEIVLSECAAIQTAQIEGRIAQDGVPFFDNSELNSVFRRLR